MSVLKGDYIGFSYNGKHSSDLGIVRTSNGSRFDESLLPTMQDKTAQVPGGDGTYYFGSYYTQRPFPVSFAFDNLTEEQVATIKSHFGDKKIHDLVFDERPYKIYRAKVTGSATMKYIPFSEGSTNRVYKGEGTIQFTCYDPFARCEKKWWSQYSDSNVGEWKEASGLKEQEGNFDKLLDNNTIKVYNPGDIDAHFLFKMNFGEKDLPAGEIYLNNGTEQKMTWEKIERLGEDTFVKINTKLNLIEGYNKEGYKSGNVYNKHIISGDFFKIPASREDQLITVSESLRKYITPSEVISYNYYYL